MLTKTSFTIRLHPADDVVIARQQLVSGTVLLDEKVTISGLIPPGHKVATHAIRVGEPVKRYNQIIGFAKRPIGAGEHVHLHNLAMGEFTRDYAIGADAKPTQFADPAATFMGIVRPDGRVATRNYIGILSTVNCSATVSHGIADAFKGEALAQFPNVDGVLIVGLGCEANQINALLGAESLQEGPLLHTFSIQDTGGTGKSIAKGVAMVREMLPHANRVTRERVPASHLVLGLQCGGSDGYSGITANPALGAAVDRLVRHGGTAILSETPEIYGAEHLLTRRAVSKDVAEKLISRIRWWEDYTTREKGEMNNNPSPGNKAGGLTTILEKSLGAVAKGGTTNLVDVYEYAEHVTAHGFVYMDTPGYDPVSATGEVAGGANMICFTTGRGSAYGCAPSPSLKLATNSALWVRQEEDIDLNCGGVVDGDATVGEVGERLFRMMLDAASGTRTKSERHGYGQSEFVPWYVGAVM